MFDQLGGVDVRYEDRSHKWLVDFLHESDGPLAVAADNNTVGLHEIRHCATFAEELGIAHDVELRAGFVVAADGVCNLLAGFYRHGALINNNTVLALLENCSNFASHLLDIR